MSQVSVLFVCLGNICRSPTAEGVFRKLAADAGLAASFLIDSAGTGDWHVGQPPDRRMTATAARRGYSLEGRARTVSTADFERFDHIFAMDRSNLRDLQKRAPAAHGAYLRLFRDDDPEGRGEDVPDPYYGEDEGFEEVVTIVERTCRALLERLSSGHR